MRADIPVNLPYPQVKAPGAPLRAAPMLSLSDAATLAQRGGRAAILEYEGGSSRRVNSRREAKPEVLL